MKVIVPSAGAYVLAVSGGVDSVVLLDVLAHAPGLVLTVAHFDHGIRDDSRQDRLLVQKLAGQYGLPFEYAEGRLGAGASEAAARAARYEFLRGVQKKRGAAATITAHHQDDVIETAIINMLRGSGRKGLTALADRPDLRRPLINVPKRDILTYAGEHGLTWREDSTNQDEAYLRNYVRRQVVPKLSEADRAEFLHILNKLSNTNKVLDKQIEMQLKSQPSRQLSRAWFARLPHHAAREIMAAWLRQNGIDGFDTKTLERLTITAKTARAGKRADVRAGAILRISRDDIVLE